MKVPSSIWRASAFVWAVVIFVTSCTVVKSKEFVHAVGSVAPGQITESSFDRFWRSWWWVFVKGYHVTEFAILTFLLIRWLKNRLISVPISLAALYAASDEIHQLWVPERGGRVTDWLIDMIGVILAAILSFWIRSRSDHRASADLSS